MRSLFSRLRNPKGSVLIYALIMLTIAGIAVYTVVKASATNLKITSRSEQRLNAQYASEAAVQQAIDWFNRGHNTWLQNMIVTMIAEGNTSFTSLDPDSLHTWSDGLFPDSDFQNAFAPDPATGRFIDVNRQSVFTQTVNVKTNYADFIPIVRDNYGNNHALVTDLIIDPPDPGDPEGTICRITVRSESPLPDYSVDPPMRGIISVIEAQLVDNEVAYLEIMAAIMSKSVVISNGQLNAHWGEIWAKQDIDIPNTAFNDVPLPSNDPWYFARAERYLTIGGKHTDGTQKLGYRNQDTMGPIPTTAANYYIPYLTATLHPDIHRIFKNRENLVQHAGDLQWPNYDYQTIKNIAIQFGFPIYRTTADGKIVYDRDLNGNPVSPVQYKRFDEVFANLTIPDEINYDEMPPLYFIDTIDGQPPRVDGTNMATLTEQGNGAFYYGLFFMAANLNMQGQGNPPNVMAEKPDLTLSNIRKCRTHGLLYSYGSFDHNGSGVVYGAVYAERGFGAGGCPEVYYDHRLKDLLRNRIGSPVIPSYWDTYFETPYNDE